MAPRTGSSRARTVVAAGAAAALCLAASLAGSAVPATPDTVSATYNLYLNGAHVAVMNETFEARSERYRIVSEGVPLGVLALLQKPATATSSGQLTDAGLRPERFEGRRIGSGQVQAEFDWSAGRLTYARDGKAETVELPAGTQDRLSIMYQFMFQRFNGGDRLDLSVTDGRRLTRYQYSIKAEVELDTPLGRIPALHLVRQGAADGGGTEIWLAREQRFLPVKMVIQEPNGNRYEQVATRIEFGSARTP